MPDGIPPPDTKLELQVRGKAPYLGLRYTTCGVAERSADARYTSRGCRFDGAQTPGYPRLDNAREAP
jgi:hypothetical protein